MYRFAAGGQDPGLAPSGPVPAHVVTAPVVRSRYERSKDRLKPYTGTLWSRHPRLYRWGKALEARLIGRS